MDKEKNFFNVVNLSKDFDSFGERLAKFVEKSDDKAAFHLGLLFLAASAELAIAQQLTVISKHLGEIVAKSKTL